MKPARAEEVTDDDASLALRGKNLQSVDAAFLADWRHAGSEIARQQEPSRRSPIITQRDIEVEFSQGRLAWAHFAKLDLRRRSGRFRLSKVLYQ